MGPAAGSRLADHLEHIAAKEHIARLTGTHPPRSPWPTTCAPAWTAGRRHHLAVSRTYDTVVVRTKHASERSCRSPAEARIGKGELRPGRAVRPARRVERVDHRAPRRGPAGTV
ncbi:hypothetical protein ACU686_11830 [Yinghuangia aomiensis]